MFYEHLEWHGFVFTIVADDTAVIEIRRDGDNIPRPNAITALAVTQLSEYFDGKRKTFTVPVAPEKAPMATVFRLAVWDMLAQVPYGEAVTYGELATRLGKPGAARAIGGAVGANPLLVVIPCHRVMAADGIGGFSAGLELKRALLDIEGIQ